MTIIASEEDEDLTNAQSVRLVGYDTSGDGHRQVLDIREFNLPEDVSKRAGFVGRRFAKLLAEHGVVAVSTELFRRPAL